MSAFDDCELTTLALAIITDFNNEPQLETNDSFISKLSYEIDEELSQSLSADMDRCPSYYNNPSLNPPSPPTYSNRNNKHRLSLPPARLSPLIVSQSASDESLPPIPHMSKSLTVPSIYNRHRSRTHESPLIVSQYNSNESLLPIPIPLMTKSLTIYSKRNMHNNTPKMDRSKSFSRFQSPYHPPPQTRSYTPTIETRDPSSCLPRDNTTPIPCVIPDFTDIKINLNTKNNNYKNNAESRKSKRKKKKKQQRVRSPSTDTKRQKPRKRNGKVRHKRRRIRAHSDGNNVKYAKEMDDGFTFM